MPERYRNAIGKYKIDRLAELYRLRSLRRGLLLMVCTSSRKAMLLCCGRRIIGASARPVPKPTITASASARRKRW